MNSNEFGLFFFCWCVSGTLLFFHQAPQVEKESGAEGEEDIGILKNHFGQLMTIVNFILLAMVFQTYAQFHYHVYEYYTLV